MDTVRSADPRLAELRALAAALEGTLRTCQALLDARRPVDLTGFADRVGRLCAACLDLPPEQGRLLRHALAELLARLDLAEAALRLAGPCA